MSSETDVLYREANIFVLFSDTEGSPIVLIEAMAFSIPIITTELGQYLICYIIKWTLSYFQLRS